MIQPRNEIRIKEMVELSVKTRILALRLLEKQKANPQLAKQLGIEIKIIENFKRSEQNGNV